MSWTSLSRCQKGDEKDLTVMDCALGSDPPGKLGSISGKVSLVLQSHPHLSRPLVLCTPRVQLGMRAEKLLLQT